MYLLGWQVFLGILFGGILLGVDLIGSVWFGLVFGLLTFLGAVKIEQVRQEGVHIAINSIIQEYLPALS